MGWTERSRWPILPWIRRRRRGRSGAVRTVNRALRRLADDDELWMSLYDRADTRGSKDAVDLDAVAAAVGDLMTEQLAVLLIRTG